MEAMIVNATVVSVTLAGSLGTAWMIQRAILAGLLKALADRRR